METIGWSDYGPVVGLVCNDISSLLGLRNNRWLRPIDWERMGMHSNLIRLLHNNLTSFRVNL